MITGVAEAMAIRRRGDPRRHRDAGRGARHRGGWPRAQRDRARPGPDAARRRAYDAADLIEFDGRQIRTDIAARAVERAGAAADNSRRRGGTNYDWSDHRRAEAETDPSIPRCPCRSRAASPPRDRHGPDVEVMFEEIEVDAPLVGIIIGSPNDKPKMQPAGKALQRRASPTRSA